MQPVDDRLDRERAMRTVLRELLGIDVAAPTIGRYALDRWLGAGTQGTVWSAWDPMMQRSVAIKRLRLRHHGDLVRAREEARALAALDHPYVVAVYDVVHEDDELYIVMQRIRGESLATWLARRPPGSDVLELLERLAEGLAAIHAAGLLHRDLKPSNVQVFRGSPSIVDFGLASPQQGAAAAVGTPEYMAPEQRRGEAIDARADQYAFGVIGREAIADALDLRGARRRVVEAVFARCRAASPEHRFVDMPAVVAELRRARAATPLRRRLPIAMACLAGLATAIGLGAATAGAPELDCEGPRIALAGQWHGLRPLVFARLPGDADLHRELAATLDEHLQAVDHGMVSACASPQREAWQRCLADRSAELLEFAANLAERAPATTSEIVRAIGRIPSARSCEPIASVDAQRLADEQWSADAAQAVAEIDALIRRSETLAVLGDREAALAGVREALVRASQLGNDRLIARARWREGYHLRELGRMTEAIAALEQAFHEAQAAGMLREAQRIANAIVVAHAERYERRPAIEWAAHARSLLQRTGNSPLGAMELAEALGLLAFRTGDTDRALAYLEEALHYIEIDGRRGSNDELKNRFNRAAILLDTGRRREARAEFERILDLEQRRYGPDHPELITTLKNLASAELQLGRFATAERRLVRAMFLAERHRAGGIVDLTFSRFDVALASGELERASSLLASLEPISDDPILRARVALRTARLHRASGRSEPAAALLQGALAELAGLDPNAIIVDLLRAELTAIRGEPQDGHSGSAATH